MTINTVTAAGMLPDQALALVEELQIPKSGMPSSGASATSPPVVEAEVPSDWIANRVGDVTISVPPDWTASNFSAPDEGSWFKGSELFPEASLSIHRDTTVEEIRRAAVLRDKSRISVAGGPALQYVVERTDWRAEKGLIIVLLDQRFTGTVIVTAFAPVERADQMEPVFRRILSTIEVNAEPR